MKNAVSLMAGPALTFSLVLAPGLYGQVKTDAQSKLDRVEGTVQSIDKDKMVITIKQTGSANAVWKISYNKDTKWSYRNEDSTFDEVKEGRRVVCLGKVEGPTTLLAARVDIRTK